MVFDLPSQSCRIGSLQVTGSASSTIRNPATGEILACVPHLGAKEAALAVDAASSAFRSWSRGTAYDRAALLTRWADLIEDRYASLAELLTAEQGKPLKEAQRELRYGNSFVRWYAEEAKRVYGETIPSERADQRILILKQPLGVVAAITPWNFPVAMVLRKVAPALAAGCTVVLKPAPETPLSALQLVELAAQAGIPEGVLNIVTGPAEDIGAVWMADPRVRKVTFTGSTEVGRLLMSQSARTLKKLTLELGGNAAMIVCADADLARALSGSMFGKFRNAGQTCISVNRFLLHDHIAQSFTERFVEQVRSLRVGNGSDPSSDIGPLINEDGCNKVEDLVNDALRSGATLLLGGKRIKGTFFAPTVLADVTPSMRIAQEEIFGPVACLSTFNDDDTAIRTANDISHGLVHYVYTEQLSRAFRYSEELEAGMVGINGTAISCAHAPFGGIKQSGYGREGGHHGIDEFLQVKYVSIGIAP